MENKGEIYHLWLQYRAKNEEEYFCMFVRGFVSIWEDILDLSWSSFPDWASVKSDGGPHLDRLPEELLPTVSHFMQVARKQTEENSLNCEVLSEVEHLVRLLTVIARNFDNIPLVASCDYVSASVSLAAAVIHQLVEESAHYGEAGFTYFVSLCRFLEVLYDPYFTWRHFLRGSEADYTKLTFQPALLHVEVIPFIYDCFRTNLVDNYPDLGSELLHVLGAAVAGAQHNALRAICPATASILMAVLRPSYPAQLRHTALQCFVLMVRVLLRSSPDQRQIEVGTLLQQLLGVVQSVSGESWTPDSLHSLTQMVSALRSLLTAPETPNAAIANNAAIIVTQVQQAMIDNQVIKALLTLLRRGAQEEGDKQSLAVEIVGTVSMFLTGNNLTKDRFKKANGYNRLLEALKALGLPRRPLLKALVAMSTEECSDNVPNEGSKLKNGEALMLCFKWLPEVSQVDQVWLAESLSRLCTASLQSRVLSCGHSVILTTCSLLEMGASLPRPVAGELLGLLENLASHSITPRELKQVFLLLRDGTEDEKCPYRSHLLRVISTVARRSDYGDCHFFFDVQNDTDGLSVPGIRKWSGAGYGFTFHCWVKLEADSSSDNSGGVSPATPATPSTPSTPVTPGTPATPLRNISSDSSSRRRQLFTLLTSSNTGMEAFFRSDGILVVGLSTKKEFITATVPEPALNDGHWHCIQISLMTARRPFGHNQLAVFIDGAQKLSASMKFPTMAEPFTYCTIGSVIQRGTTNAPSPSGDTCGRRGSSSGLIPSLINQVPSYFSLPLPLRSASQLAPHVKSFQAGLENMLFGPAGPIRGQLGLCALLHDALTPQHARLLHQSGCNSRALFVTDSSAPTEFQDMTNRLVFCFSPAACWNNLCLDLAPGNKYDGHVVATQCQTLNIKTAINGIGGIHVLFPILEGSAEGDGGPDLSLLTSAPPLLRVTASGTGTITRKTSDDLDDWEVLPSSSYSDSKLELNPASGFISLLRNLLCASALNQEQLLKNNGTAILGDLLSKIRPQLLDVNILMAVQLLVEMARDVDNPALLRALHQHVLFNFRIWSRGPFHIRIGHIQYISSVIKEDRKSFRKRYGVSFFLDTIRQYHTSTLDLLGVEDSRSLRHAILGLIKYYIGKEVNVREVGSIISFLCSVKEEILVFELLEMLIVHLEGHCMDQLYLLLFEPLSAELLYCLLADSKFTMDLKQKVVKLISVLLRSERIYERHKARLRLHDVSVLGIRSSPNMGMYPGLVSHLYEQTLSMEVVNMLLDQMLMTENHASYAGVLSLLHLLASAELDIKVEAARKVLTTLYMRPTAAATFAKQMGWQDCVSRLLIKRPISSAVSTAEEATDLMTFEDDLLDFDRVGGSRSPSSVSRLSASVSDAAYVLENEIKEVAERASHAVADNIHYAADNLSSVMASAYSVFKQKTVEMQESLEEFGESVQRLKTRHSLPTLSESPRSSRTGDSISIDTRSESDSSDDDMSSSGQSTDLSTGSGSSSLSPGPPSIEVFDSQTEEQREMAEALKEWQTLEASKEWDRQDDLTYFVLHILFMIFWHGVDSNSRDAWKERGEVMAGINLLGLNNELYSSHLQLKLRLLEMAVTAVLSDLREASTSPTPTSSSLVNRIENAQQLLRWVYDLSVLDPNSDCSKKMSVKLLDGVLGILDVLPVFQEGLPEEKSDLPKLAFGILLSAAASSQQDVCAMATAKLHALVCTRRHADTQETAYLLYRIDEVVRQSCREHYTFLIPVVKALVEKIQKPLSLADHCPGCVSGNDFFEDFPKNQESNEWKNLIEKELSVLAAVLAVVVLSVSGEPQQRERDRESHRESLREREPVRTRREPPSRHHYGPPQSQISFGSPPKYAKGYRGATKAHYGPLPHASGHHSPGNSRYGPHHKNRGSAYKSGKNSGRPAPPDSFGASQTYGRPVRASSVGPTKTSYGPPRGYGPPKPHHSHSGKGSYGVPSKSIYHHKTKYSSHPKPLKYPSSSKYSYPPTNNQPSSEYAFKPSTPFASSSEYKAPSSSSSSPSYDSTKLYNSYGESPASGNYGSTWYTSSSSSSSSDSDSNSYDTSSLYPASSSTKAKGSQEHATYTEIQPSISYTLPASFESDSSKSPSNVYNRGSSRPTTTSSSSSYKTSTSANSYQAPIAHGGAATSYVSVSHDDSSAPSKVPNYGSYSGSGTQAVVTTSYRAPSSTYSHNVSPTYTSSKTPHVYSGSYKTSSPSASYPSHDIQAAASSSHETTLTQNQFKPTNNFSFLPYKQQATSQVKDTSVGLSPDEWDSYYGSPSSSYQEASTQGESLSPNYYDPVAAPLSEKSTSSSTSRKKDITRVHQKMLQQSSGSQSQSGTYSKPAHGYDTDNGSSSDARSR